MIKKDELDAGKWLPVGIDYFEKDAKILSCDITQKIIDAAKIVERQYAHHASRFFDSPSLAASRQVSFLLGARMAFLSILSSYRLDSYGDGEEIHDEDEKINKIDLPCFDYNRETK